MVEALQTPIIDLRFSTDPTEDFIDVKVDPSVMADSRTLSSFKWTLAGLVNADQIWPHSDQEGGFDLRMMVSGGINSRMTRERLNKKIADQHAGGCWVDTVRCSTTRDMVVNVVINPYFPRVNSGRRLVGYHVSAVHNELGAQGVMNAKISDDPIYEGVVMRLFVPQIGLSLPLERLERLVRDLMTSEFAMPQP